MHPRFEETAEDFYTARHLPRHPHPHSQSSGFSIEDELHLRRGRQQDDYRQHVAAPMYQQYPVYYGGAQSHQSYAATASALPVHSGGGYFEETRTRKRQSQAASFRNPHTSHTTDTSKRRRTDGSTTKTQLSKSADKFELTFDEMCLAHFQSTRPSKNVVKLRKQAMESLRTLVCATNKKLNLVYSQSDASGNSDGLIPAAVASKRARQWQRAGASHRLGPEFECEIVSFGSTELGVDTEASDLDVAIRVDLNAMPQLSRAEVNSLCRGRRFKRAAASQSLLELDPTERCKLVKYLNTLFKQMRRAKQWKGHFIRYARVPILKMEFWNYSKGGRNGGCVHVDISVTKDQSAKLRICYVSRYTMFSDPLIRPLMLAVKLWASNNGINDAMRSYMNSFGWLLCVISFLQNCKTALLPVFEFDGSLHHNQSTMHLWDASARKSTGTMLPRPSLLQLFMGFLNFMLHFSVMDLAMTVTAKRGVSRRNETLFSDKEAKRNHIWINQPCAISKMQELSASYARLTLEDESNAKVTLNVSRNVNYDTWADICQVIEQTLAVIEDSVGCVSFYPTHVADSGGHGFAGPSHCAEGQRFDARQLWHDVMCAHKAADSLKLVNFATEKYRSTGHTLVAEATAAFSEKRNLNSSEKTRTKAKTKTKAMAKKKKETKCREQSSAVGKRQQSEGHIISDSSAVELRTTSGSGVRKCVVVIPDSDTQVIDLVVGSDMEVSSASSDVTPDEECAVVATVSHRPVRKRRIADARKSDAASRRSNPSPKKKKTKVLPKLREVKPKVH